LHSAHSRTIDASISSTGLLTAASPVLRPPCRIARLQHAGRLPKVRHGPLPHANSQNNQNIDFGSFSPLSGARHKQKN
jgi:hypothetical protein